MVGRPHYLKLLKNELHRSKDHGSRLFNTYDLGGALPFNIKTTQAGPWTRNSTPSGTPSVFRPDGRPPRVHDLRFSFVAHALLRWYNAGINVQAKLPALSAYLGHVSVASTQYYLTFLDSVGQAACDRFDQHCSQFLKGVHQ
mgnify:CR=1 FL=1